MKRKEPLTADMVVNGYLQGAFPMADPDTGRVNWYRPDPRAVIPVGGLHISRSLAKTLRQGRFEIGYNLEFEQVMRACADRDDDTWISEEFVEVYTELHGYGLAHSVEVYLGEALVGGLYGVALNGAFMAESMFHHADDASKVAMVGLQNRLVERGFTLLDVQFLTPHLERMGAIEIPGDQYLAELERAVRRRVRFD